MADLNNKITGKYNIIPINNNDKNTNLTVLKNYDKLIRLTVNQRGLSNSMTGKYEINPIENSDKDIELNVLNNNDKNINLVIPESSNSDKNISLNINPHNRVSGIYDIIEPPKITVELEAIKDAFVRSNYPYLDYGLESEMAVGNQYNEVFRSLVQFDINSIPTVNTVIVSAKLKLYKAFSTRSNGDKELSLDTNDKYWSEQGTTWVNQPNIDEHITNFTVGDEIGYIEVDVTNIFLDWYTGTTTNNGFKISAVNELDTFLKVFYTKEADNNRPILEVTYRDDVIYSGGQATKPINLSLDAVRYEDKEINLIVTPKYRDDDKDITLTVDRRDTRRIRLGVSRKIIPISLGVYNNYTTDIPASITVKFPTDVSDKNVNLVIPGYEYKDVNLKILNDNNKDVNLNIWNRSDISGQLVIPGYEYKNINLTVLDDNTINGSLKIIDRSDIPGTLVIPGYSYKDINLNLLQDDNKDINLKVLTSQDKLINLAVLGKELKDVNIEVLNNNDIPTTIDIRYKSQIPGTIAVNTDAFRDISIEVLYDNNKDVIVTVPERSDIVGKLVIPDYSYKDVDIKVLNNNDVPISISILDKVTKAINLKVLTKSEIDGILIIPDREDISGSLSIPYRSDVDINLIAMQRTYSDKVATLVVSKGFIGYVFIM